MSVKRIFLKPLKFLLRKNGWHIAFKKQDYGLCFCRWYKAKIRCDKGGNVYLRIVFMGIGRTYYISDNTLLPQYKMSWEHRVNIFDAPYCTIFVLRHIFGNSYEVLAKDFKKEYRIWNI